MPFFTRRSKRNPPAVPVPAPTPTSSPSPAPARRRRAISRPAAKPSPTAVAAPASAPAPTRASAPGPSKRATPSSSPTPASASASASAPASTESPPRLSFDEVPLSSLDTLGSSSATAPRNRSSGGVDAVAHAAARAHAAAQAVQAAHAAAAAVAPVVAHAPLTSSSVSSSPSSAPVRSSPAAAPAASSLSSSSSSSSSAAAAAAVPPTVRVKTATPPDAAAVAAVRARVQFAERDREDEKRENKVDRRCSSGSGSGVGDRGASGVAVRGRGGNAATSPGGSGSAAARVPIMVDFAATMFAHGLPPPARGSGFVDMKGWLGDIVAGDDMVQRWSEAVWVLSDHVRAGRGWAGNGENGVCAELFGEVAVVRDFCNALTRKFMEKIPAGEVNENTVNSNAWRQEKVNSLPLNLFKIARFFVGWCLWNERASVEGKAAVDSAIAAVRGSQGTNTDEAGRRIVARLGEIYHDEALLPLGVGFAGNAAFVGDFMGGVAPAAVQVPSVVDASVGHVGVDGMFNAGGALQGDGGWASEWGAGTLTRVPTH